MKFYRLFNTTLLTTVALLSPLSPVRAQSNPARTVSPAATKAEPEPLPSADASSLSIQINGGTISSAVGELQNAVEAAHKPPMNVLFGPGVQEITVPTLTLRKVSGPDALKLIAVSAGCEVLPIRGEKVDGIGYQIVAATPPPSGAVIPARQAAVGATRGIRRNEVALALPSKSGGSPLTATISKTPIADQPGPGTTQSVISFTSPVLSGANVRVYPLGEITTQVKFNDVEKTLQEVLQAAGVTSDSAKFALHEKTNVLVVTGEPRVQEVVVQYLEALQKNTAAAASQRSREEDLRRQAVEFQMRSDLEQRERASLQERLKDTEAALTKVQRELDRVSATTSPKPN